MKLSFGVIIGICLIVYWYMKDHPRATQPAPTTQGYYDVILHKAA